MKKLLFILILSGFSSSLFALPANVQKDQYYNALEKDIDNKKYEKTKNYILKLDLLIKEKKIKIKSDYYYYKAKSSYENLQFSDVYPAVEKYIEITGRNGRYYKKILEILNDTDNALSKEIEKQREQELGIFILKGDMFEDTQKNGSDDGLSLNWSEAKKYCEDLEHANFSDWTLPTKHQLELLQKEKKNLQFVKDSNYWSISTNKEDSGVAWSVDFTHGSLSNTDKFDNYFSVRCVR